MKLDEIVLEPRRTLVLAIDIQNDFLEDKTGYVFHDAGNDISQMRSMVIDNLIPFLERSASESGHIAFVRSLYEVGKFPKPYDRLCSASPGADLFLIDTILPNLEFIKTEHDPFTNNDLRQYIQQHGIGNVVLTGVTLTHCIDAAVKSAMKMPGLKIVVPEDCVGYRKERTPDAQRILYGYAADPSIIVVNSKRITYS